MMGLDQALVDNVIPIIKHLCHFLLKSLDVYLWDPVQPLVDDNTSSSPYLMLYKMCLPRYQWEHVCIQVLQLSGVAPEWVGVVEMHNNVDLAKRDDDEIISFSMTAALIALNTTIYFWPQVRQQKVLAPGVGLPLSLASCPQQCLRWVSLFFAYWVVLLKRLLKQHELRMGERVRLTFGFGFHCVFLLG